MHENLSLFVTVVQDILSDDPDLEELKFEILDFSAPRGSNIRSISVIDASEIPRVSPQRKNEMLQIFADGFILAKETLGARPRAGKDAEKDEDRTAGGLQPDLFL
ncbi:hypothetical protein ACEYYA_14440 [Paracoccus sp. p3-h83]|uniref:hypothetical protein n=1 Tax=Paracoccus sp. p3-h83 TaxID=3342805 RepID=UPI0035B9E900